LATEIPIDSRLKTVDYSQDSLIMKFSIKSYNAVAMWKWDTHPPNQPDNHKLYHYAPTKIGTDAYGNEEGLSDDDEDDDEEEDDVCGICRLAFESTCPECKIPGDDCPLSEWRIGLKRIWAAGLSIIVPQQWL
jgi:hypothetical protein